MNEVERNRLSAGGNDPIEIRIGERRENQVVNVIERRCGEGNIRTPVKIFLQYCHSDPVLSGEFGISLQ